MLAIELPRLRPLQSSTGYDTAHWQATKPRNPEGQQHIRGFHTTCYIALDSNVSLAEIGVFHEASTVHSDARGKIRAVWSHQDYTFLVLPFGTKENRPNCATSARIKVDSLNQGIPGIYVGGMSTF